MAKEENFGHEHPLILLNGSDEQRNDEIEKASYCFRCKEVVLPSIPRYSCVQCRDFFLHKLCAEAPLEINHPFHPDHPLLLLQNPSYSWICDFCSKFGDRFVYHCSCGLDLHIKCALFTYYMAQSKLKFDPGEVIDSLIFRSEIHKKCADLPLEINHISHRKHPLLLQFHTLNYPSCKVCQYAPHSNRLAYCCLHCKFALHIECVSPSPPPIIKHKSHQHPFTLFWRRAPFICDACGLEGNLVAYACSTCSIIVHEKCISLPRRIKSRWHEDHYLSHAYFLEDEKFKNDDCICIVCLDEVNTDFGSYNCSDCQILAHANCATKHYNWYSEVENEDDDNSSDILALSPIIVIETNDAGEATKIKHFKHIHHLILGSVKMEEYDTLCCDGCILPILPPYFRCSECDFFLHKVCAELPKKKQVWLHECKNILSTLVSADGGIFKCNVCEHLSNGFGYKCNQCWQMVCFKCVSTLTQRPIHSLGHPHPLSFYLDYEGQCHGCGEEISRWGYYCKKCNFALGPECLTLPTRAQHKCDEKHLLALTYHDENDYPATHYCDICEERRDPSPWFYRCPTCNTSAHVKCVLGDFPFIKVGSILHTGRRIGGTFVKKIYYYPKCIRCDQPCQDLALESEEHSYIHVKCYLKIFLSGEL